jgi:hypothetical protein
LAYDGSNVWVSNWNSSTVSKLRASDGVNLGTFPTPYPLGVAFDGANIWFANIYAGTVTKM